MEEERASGWVGLRVWTQSTSAACLRTAVLEPVREQSRDQTLRPTQERGHPQGSPDPSAVCSHPGQADSTGPLLPFLRWGCGGSD